MGYISSATTEYIDLHISEYGRKFLLQGSLADQITQFALGDIDKGQAYQIKSINSNILDQNIFILRK